MDVVILCGGKGTRLSEDTHTTPKPMVTINEIPILLHIMKIYSFYGFNRFILALGYKGDYIKQYFYNYKIIKDDLRISFKSAVPIKYMNNGNDIDWDVTLIDTGQDVLKGERIRKLKRYILSDDFHLTYSDGVGNINIDELVRFHTKHQCIGTVTAVHPPSRFGQLILKDDTVTSFEEKSQMNDEYINGGFFVFNKKVFKYIGKNDEKDFEFGTLKFLAEIGELKAYKHKYFWQCMDNVRDRNYLNKLAKSGNLPWMDLKKGNDIYA